MEYIPAPSLMNKFGSTLSKELQLQLVRFSASLYEPSSDKDTIPPQVQSLRHALRVIQYSDISQHDWHLGQVLCNPVETRSQALDGSNVHCVLVDFSQASVSIDQQEFHRVDDFGQCLRTLCNPKSGFNADLVWENFGSREHWDMVAANVNVNAESKWTEKTSPIANLVPWEP